MLTLAMAPWLLNLMMVFFVGLSVLMVLVVLIQRSQGGGLTAAFGGAGAGSGQTAFGTKTGDVLTIITIGIFAVWLLMAVGLNFASRPDTGFREQPAATGAPQGVPTDETEDVGGGGAPADGGTQPQTPPSGEGASGGATPTSDEDGNGADMDNGGS
ncbi:MAG: preprotein translocase subunit SecG [Phycisphaeraceae bacterium]|nr:preprotein translocase subunit SecG [Phycisphaeraceae bacterium]MCW5753557.1 preprotein translocase subunit SecG [Phycisphaeraceae bacterium]